MEFADLVRRRRMVHHFAPRALAPEVLDAILESARHAPSAGFSQGLGLIVLDDSKQLEWLWQTTQGKGAPADGPPVIVLPVPDKRVYLERYRLADKGGPEGPRSVESGWPVPYFWDLDAAMACMLLLLKAVDLGVGAWLFGVQEGHDEVVRTLGVPEGLRVIGAIGLGYAAEGDRMEGSSVTRPRRPLTDLVHRGAW